MLATSRVLADLVQNYLGAAHASGDYRVIVPGLTDQIGEEVHTELCSRGVNSYLVIGRSRSPDQSQRWLLPVSLTTMRIGSFVAVADPGALADIQDSIRGSGGTIRSCAFSEEWPWIDDGPEAFRFAGPFLSRLLAGWTDDAEKQKWLCMLIREVLIGATRQVQNRAPLMLERLLGKFNPNTPADLPGPVERFLFHCGIPMPSSIADDPRKVVRSMQRGLLKPIFDRVRDEPDVREQVLSNIPDDDTTATMLREAVKTFFDGLGDPSVLDGGVLSLRHCWGEESIRLRNWRLLTADRLRELFEVQQPQPVTLEVSIGDRERILVSADRNEGACPVSADVPISVRYEIPAEDFHEGTCLLQMGIRTRTITEQALRQQSGNVQLEVNIESTGLSYRSHVPVRLSIVIEGEKRAEAKVRLHCCGEQRPAFVVTTPPFWVDDAEEVSEDDPAPDRRHRVEDQVRLHLFPADGAEPEVHCEEDEEQLVESNGIWSTARQLDVFGQPGGQITCRCDLGSRWVSLTYEAAEIEHGEFTLEDELRDCLVNARVDRVKEMVAIHDTSRRDPYPRLGGITDQVRQRVRLARCFENRSGWRAILADLLNPSDGLEIACGDFAHTVGDVADVSAIGAAELADEALELLQSYTEKRDAFRQPVIETLDLAGSSPEHPEYAIFPLFLCDAAPARQRVEQSLCEYLEAYKQLQLYVRSQADDMDWAQAFLLIHLDCVVHWGSDSAKNCFFLLGPWHPLVVAKRFMVQRALVLRAQRLLEKGGKEFCQLASLLAHVPGFHWHPCLKAEDVALEPAYVVSTSDPGWHLAFKRQAAESYYSGNDQGLLSDIFTGLRSNLGLEPSIHLPTSGTMLRTALGGYLRTFPSKRYVGAWFPAGFRGHDEVVAVDTFLHSDGEPTPDGEKLAGGAGLSFRTRPTIPEDVCWTNPALKVFRYEDPERCVAEQHPDIQFCQAGSGLRFLASTDSLDLPRGSEYGSAFDSPVLRLTEGQAFIPQSVTVEWDRATEVGTSLGEAFLEACGHACESCGPPQGVVRSTPLPSRLQASWTIVPGAVLDPAVFVRYVKNGQDRNVEERALWDYHVSLSTSSSSFFVISRIPATFRGAVNGIFGDTHDHASTFVTELGRMGLAIAGEAMKSGRHALGTVGLVGAVRLFVGDEENPGPLRCGNQSLGFLLPVDSFREVFDKASSSSAKRDDEVGHRRADLLAVVLTVPRQEDANLVIQAVAVECKYSSTTYPATHVPAALEQARATTATFRRICELALSDWGVSERLALLQLVRFGLRLWGGGGSDERNRCKAEGRVYQKILKAEFEYRAATTNALLVSTEMGLPGAAEMNPTQGGRWIRLNRDNWPGVAETTSIANIRRGICDVFELPEGSDRGSQTELEEAPTFPSEPESTSISDIAHAPEEASTSQPASQGQSEEAEAPASKAEEEPESEEDTGGPSGVTLHRILVGMDSARQAVYFDPYSPVDRLDNANVMITGSSGKGKTQLVKYLVEKVRKQSAGTLILDFKNDFASDSHFVTRAELEQVLVSFDGMPFNPLIPYPVADPRSGNLFIQCAQHITGIASVFRRTYGLGAQQEAAVKNAIRQAFTEVGVDPSGMTPHDPDRTFPDLSRVGDLLEQANPSAYNRLDPLFTLGLFREQYWRRSFADMITRSAVIDFSQIPSDPLKNALAELIVLSAHAFLNSQPHCGGLRQAFVVDEAHRILRADYLGQFSLECRAYGLSLILSSQYPSHFPREISASMATKIIHGNDRDVDRVREIVNLLGCQGREPEVAELGMFEALFSNKHHENTRIRTITYPLHLVLAALGDVGEMSREDVASIEGVDTSKLSAGNLARHLERLGLCELTNGSIRLISRES